MSFSEMCPGSLARFLLQILSFCFFVELTQHNGQIAFYRKRTGMMRSFSSDTALYGLAEDHAGLFDGVLLLFSEPKRAGP